MEKKYIAKLSRLLGLLEQMEPRCFLDWDATWKCNGNTHNRFKQSLSELRDAINEACRD